MSERQDQPPRFCARTRWKSAQSAPNADEIRLIARTKHRRAHKYTNRARPSIFGKSEYLQKCLARNKDRRPDPKRPPKATKGKGQRNQRKKRVRPLIFDKLESWKSRDRLVTVCQDQRPPFLCSHAVEIRAVSAKCQRDPADRADETSIGYTFARFTVESGCRRLLRRGALQARWRAGRGTLHSYRGHARIVGSGSRCVLRCAIEVSRQSSGA